MCELVPVTTNVWIHWSNPLMRRPLEPLSKNEAFLWQSCPTNSEKFAVLPGVRFVSVLLETLAFWFVSRAAEAGHPYGVLYVSSCLLCCGLHCCRLSGPSPLHYYCTCLGTWAAMYTRAGGTQAEINTLHFISWQIPAPDYITCGPSQLVALCEHEARG